MSEHSNKARLNQISYFWTMLFAFPAFSAALSLARSVEGTVDSNMNVATFARATSIVLVVFIILWSVRRLHDGNKSGWRALFLLPPATLFFLIYLWILPSTKGENRWGEESRISRIYGIRFKGGSRIAGIVSVTLFMIYLSGLFFSFLLMTGE